MGNTRVVETDKWKAVQSTTDSSVYAIFSKQEDGTLYMHGHYYTKLHSIAGTYSVTKMNEIQELCNIVKAQS